MYRDLGNALQIKLLLHKFSAAKCWIKFVIYDMTMVVKPLCLYFLLIYKYYLLAVIFLIVIVKPHYISYCDIHFLKNDLILDNRF